MYTKLKSNRKKVSSEGLSAVHETEHIPGFIFNFLAMSHDCKCTTQQDQKLGAGQHAWHKSD
jgi:hypothetical protein